MSKKKQTEQVELPAIPAEPNGKPYSQGIWAGQVKFSCQACPFETLDEAWMQEHVRTHEKEK